VGLSMAERKAVTKQIARRYMRASKGEKGRMLDELCELTGWTRCHARRALQKVVQGSAERPRRPSRARTVRRLMVPDSRGARGVSNSCPAEPTRETPS
jgi:hypothetical protein